MKDHRTQSKLNTQIYTEACRWFVEFRSGDVDDTMRSEFDHWMRQSPEHLSAYIEIAAIWNDGATLDPAHRWTTDSLVTEAREVHENIVPLRSAVSGTAEKQPSPSGTSRRVRLVAVSIAAACILAVALFAALRIPTYATAIGEQRSIVLADGSTVELNTRSRIKVHYSDETRSIELLEGQALFQVIKDPARPFVVMSGGTVVRAVGTQFDVFKTRDGTVVTVVEGRVAIVGKGATAAWEPVSAGRQVTVRQTSVEESVHPNIAGAIAWRQRQLVFESASLTQVAEEFNRYNKRQLIIQDAGLYGFHISGVFSSTDPASLVRFLRERPGVHIIETEAEIRVTKSSR
jgi:transmembrane sensor